MTGSSGFPSPTSMMVTLKRYLRLGGLVTERMELTNREWAPFLRKCVK
jgi:hypothetical protein